MPTSPLTPSELEYARIAVERRLVTSRQVNACAERRRGGDAAHLAGMLTRLGYLDSSAAAALLREVHRQLTHRTTLALAADMERYLDVMQDGATGPCQPTRRRRLRPVRLAAGATAVALLLVSGGLAYGRWTRPRGCPPASPRHELETFVNEVENQLAFARALLGSAAGYRQDGDPPSAQASAEEALRLLDDLPLLVRDFSPALRPALEAHLREKQPELNTIHADACVVLGGIHAERAGPDDLTRALACLRQGLERTPGAPTVLLELGKVQARQGELAQARGTLQSILGADAAHVEARLELGRVHELAGDLEAALGCYTHVIELGARPAKAHLLRGQARFRLGRTGEALHDLERVVELEDDSYEGYLWLGRALLACGRFGEAQDALTEAIDLNPARPDGYAARGELYAAQRKHAEAIKDFEVALSRSATHHEARLGLGRALEELLDHDRARATYEELLRAGDPAARALAATAHAALGELSLLQADPFECEREARAEARRRAAAADDTLGPWPPLARTREAAARLRAERLQAATDQLSRALALEPDHVPALLGRGRLALAQGSLDAAQTDLRAAVTALERRPVDEQASRRSRGDAQALLGLVALRRGHASDARAAFTRALELLPTCALALAGQGHAALQAGDRDAARAWFGRALSGGGEATPAVEDEWGDRPTPAPVSPSTHFTREGERHAGLSRRSKRPDAYTTARLCFARAVHENPLDAQADLGRAQLCAEWGAWDEAVALAARAVASDPFLRQGHEQLGFLFARDLPRERDATTGHPEHQRDAARAVGHFSDALALTRGDVDASFDAHFGRALARLSGDAPDVTAARADLREALIGIPVDLRHAEPARVQRSIQALDLLILLQERAGDLESASTCRDRVAALRLAARAAAREELKAGEQLRQRLDYSAAITRFDRAFALDPDLAEALHARGTCYLKIGNFVPGILDFSRALELQPRYADSFFLQMYQVSHVVDLNRVIAEVTKIVSDHPDVAHVLFLRGFYYFAKTEFKRFDRLDVERGITDLDRCLELNPKHVTALLYRGFLHHKAAALEPDLGAPCFDRALADYQAALALDPASGISLYLQALLWSVRSTEPGLAPADVAARKQRALDALRASFATEFKGWERVKNEKGFDAVRADPAFVELMRGR